MPVLTISPGGGFTGSGKLTGIVGQVSISCTSSIAGTFAMGPVQGGEIGSITSVSQCVGAGPFGLKITVTFSAAPGNPWPMAASSFSRGVISGKISNIKAAISGTGCNANVARTSATTPGLIPFTFNGSILDFVKGGDLHIWNVSGCFGLIANGDTGDISASYTITPKQTITSP